MYTIIGISSDWTSNKTKKVYRTLHCTYQLKNGEGLCTEKVILSPEVASAFKIGDKVDPIFGAFNSKLYIKGVTICPEN